MKSLSELVGNTPTLEVPHEGNRLHLKLEASNPGLSIKDRVAFHVCKKLDEEVGLKGKTVVEYSSGNLAIGLAQATKVWGFDLILVVTAQTSPDKITLLKRLGAKLVMADGSLDSNDPRGFRGFAKVIAEAKNAIFIDQYHNPLNQEAHYTSTGPEIHRDHPQASFVFSPMGTGGTASGIAKFLKDAGSSTGVIGVTPDVGVYYTTFHRLEEKRPGSDQTKIEGTGEDLIPGNLNLEILAGVLEVRDAVALLEVDKLLEETGLFVGGSSGLALAAAKQFIAKEGIRNEDLVVLCPDSGNRYLSNKYSVNNNTDDNELNEIVESYANNGYPKRI